MPLSTIFRLIYCESVLLVEETGVQIKKNYILFRDLLVKILMLIVDCIIYFFLIYIIIR